MNYTIDMLSIKKDINKYILKLFKENFEVQRKLAKEIKLEDFYTIVNIKLKNEFYTNDTSFFKLIIKYNLKTNIYTVNFNYKYTEQIKFEKKEYGIYIKNLYKDLENLF